MPSRPSRIDGRRVDRQDSGLRQRLIAAVLILAAMTPGAVRPVHAADAAFTQFIASLWPEAQAAGVSRATFDAETKGSSPTTNCPISLLPGRPATGAPSQAEFVQVPADYVKEASIARLAAEGQKLMQKHRAALDRDRKAFRRSRKRRAGDLGPRDGLRPLPAALRHAARGGDAGLCRPAQGSVPGRIHSGAEASRRGRGGAQGFSLVLGRRHRPHAIPAVRILQARRRSRRRRPGRYLEFGAGCAGLRRAAARQQGLAARRALGL